MNLANLRAVLTSQARDFLALVGIGAIASVAVTRSLAGAPTRFAAHGPEQSAFLASEPGRGRSATSPAQIPSKGWKDILKRTYAEVLEDRIITVAAGVVFYGLLALFPAVTALVSSYGLFAPADTIEHQLSFLATLLPPGAYEIVHDQIVRITSKEAATLGLGFMLGLAIALWSANAGMKALIDALNIAYEEDEKRGWFKLNAVSLAMTAGAVIGALIAIAAVVATPMALSFVGWQSGTEWIISLARWPFLLIGLLLALAVLYRYGPSRRQPKWQWVSVGAIFAAVAWIIGSSALSLYLSGFADYNASYGSLAGLIGLLMWMWMTATVILVGAELNAETEHQTAADSTVGAPKPMGLRGAEMADSVGAAQ